MPAEPSSEPAFWIPSKLACVSSCCGSRIGNRRPAGNHRLERSPVAHSPGTLLDELPERDVHRRFVDAGALHVAAHAVQLGAAVLFRSERGKPFGTVLHDQRHVAERLDVVHRRRRVVEPDDGGKGRLVARLRALAFERLEQRRLLARLVGAGAAMHEHVAVEAGPEHALADETARVGFRDRLLEHVLHVEELAADIDVGDLGADGVAGNRAPLDQQVRVALHQQVILESPRLAFVGVAGDIARLLGLPVDELPLHAGREPGAAAAAQPRGFHQFHDFFRLHRERLAQRLVALVPEIEIEREGVRLANVFGKQGIHGVYFFSLAPGPHPRRELTLTPRLGFAWPRLGVAAGAPVSPAHPAHPAYPALFLSTT